MRRFVLSALAVFVAAPAMADTVTAPVIAFDRKAKIIVLEDKTIFTLATGDAEAPEGLKAGDVVTITYESLGEDGYGVIEQIEIAG